MDKIKGLASGFFHTWVCGDSSYRTKEFKFGYKEYVDKGMFIRDIQCAPRDARYKIDHYYREDTTEEYSIPYIHIDFHTDVLKALNIDETFFWKKELVDNQSEYTYGDFTIGYKSFQHKELYPKYSLFNSVQKAFYFKYKGEINTLRFMKSSKVVDYSDKFWKEYKDCIVIYSNLEDLLHNLRYFMQYKNIINEY